MPSINLIAQRREEKRRQEQNIRKLLLSIGVEAGVFAALAAVMAARLLVVQSHLGDLDAKLDKLRPQVAQIQSLQAQTAALQPKVDTLAGAKADTLFWYKSFYAVTNSLPARTWLTSMGTGAGGGLPGAAPGAAGGDDPTLSLAGVAMSQAAVGESMLRMNQAPELDHVDLSFVQAQKIGTADAVSFQMTVHLKPESGVKDAKTAEAGGAVDAAKS